MSKKNCHWSMHNSHLEKLRKLSQTSASPKSRKQINGIKNNLVNLIVGIKSEAEKKRDMFFTKIIKYN